DKPVVSTDVGGIGDVVKAGESALLSPSNDAEAFGQNLLKIVEDDKLRNTMGSNAYDYINNKYNYTRLVKDMAQLYDELLASRL
ncbi:MAG: glycosyltransferase, partial [Cytophagales bacterium]|nr:glycosyltransferase [Cytophagales bacterium]